MALYYIRGSLLLMLFGSITASPNNESSNVKPEVVIKLSDYTNLLDTGGVKALNEIQGGRDACQYIRKDVHTGKYVYQDATNDCGKAIRVFRNLPKEAQGECYGFVLKSGGKPSRSDCVAGTRANKGYCAIGLPIQGSTSEEGNRSGSPDKSKSRNGSLAKGGEKNSDSKSSPVEYEWIPLETCIRNFKIEL